VKKLRIFKIVIEEAVILFERDLQGDLTLDSFHGVLNALKKLEPGIYMLDLVKDKKCYDLAANIDGVLMLPVRRLTKKRLMEVLEMVEEGGEKLGKAVLA